MEALYKNFNAIHKIAAISRAMISVEPIYSNIIALVLAAGILFLFNQPALFPNMGPYKNYMIYLLNGLIIMQTVKSATKSLLIPLFLLAIAGIGFVSRHYYPTLHLFKTEILQQLMLVGVIGIATSIFMIK